MVRLCIAEACIQHSARVCKGAAAALRAAAVLGLFISAAAVARPAAVVEMNGTALHSGGLYTALSTSV